MDQRVKTRRAMYSNRGARKINQDMEFSLEIAQFLSGGVCDGHGGYRIAEFFCARLQVHITKELTHLAKYHEYPFEYVVNALKKAYTQSLDDFRCEEKNFDDGEGTTLSVIVYDTRKSWATLLQVGDSSILVCDANTE